ncbi:MAG: hypothetical protein EOP07_25235, partial [Proteobacteria bacterium]
MLFKILGPLLIISLAGNFACRSASKKATDEAGSGSLPAIPAIQPPTGSNGSMDNTLFTSTLDSVDHYMAFAQESEGFILGGESVKFFIDIRTPA